ncbi:MAG: MBL fold metallo-hydrolase [Thermomicrobiales bacterium]|nr:MBL fold metallo-hydrolase [Thermomicrobiales bacterium]
MATRYSDDLYLLDLSFQGQHHAIASWLVRGERGWIIIDCGPDTTRTELVASVESAGLDMRDIERILLTHVHLDHGGGVGTLLREYPHLRVTIQAEAVQFLIDPARLIRSAGMSFGDKMERLWGEVIGFDADLVDGIVAGETVPGTSLRAYATPGHTATHLSFLDSATGVLFAGDAAHARLPESALIVPTLAPVELDFDAWHTTAQTMLGLQPSALAIPHFGWVADAQSHLEQVEERIAQRRAIAEELVRSPADVDVLTDLYAATTRAEYTAEGGEVDDKVASLELAMPSYLGGQGMMRWFKVHGWFEG